MFTGTDRSTRRCWRSARRVIGGLLIVPLLPWLCFRAAVAWLSYPGDMKDNRASVRVEDRNGVALAALVSDDGQWRMPLADSEISPHLLDAIVAVEDTRFYSHRGVDWKAMAGAAWEDIRHLRARRGASTISMQVQRLRSPGAHSFWTKLLQVIRAEQLERRQTKQEILVEYVNRAPFGGNLVGAGAACWRYFGGPCRQLSLGEAALLAGLPQSPNRLRPDRFPGRAEARRDHVLGRMLACGMITQREHDDASSEPVVAEWRPLPQDRPGGELPPADGALPTLLHVADQHHEAIVRTTLDAGIQRQTALAAREHLNLLRTSGIDALAVVVLRTQTSECLAAVSLGAKDLSIDLTRNKRSTGSTLKPFIYAAAFDLGVCQPSSLLNDSPAAWPGYQPSDYDRSFRGPLTAAEALAESRNLPAMLVLASVGIEPAIGVMDAAGLHGLARTPERYGLSLAIGGAEATPMELAGAYATLARGGVHRAVRFTPISDDSSDHETRCLRQEACWQTLTALSSIERTRGICPEACSSCVAWKTGTSSGHRDAWCAAVTRRGTVVVWLGNLHNEASGALVGQEAAAPLALRLIAMLDPHGEPWLNVPDSKRASTQPRQSTALVLVSPPEDAQFVLTRDAPVEKQRIPLRAAHYRNGAPSNAPLWWFVDDQPILTRRSDCAWWDPMPGAHEVRVVDENGRSAGARIVVRRE